MSSAPLLVAVAMPSRLPSLPLYVFLPLHLCPSGSVSPAFLPLLGHLAVLPGPPVFIAPLTSLVMARRDTVSLPAVSVPVPVASVTPVAVPVLSLLALHVAQRCAAEAVLQAGLRWLACLSTIRPNSFLMMVVVVVKVRSSAVVVNVLALVFQVQG